VAQRSEKLKALDITELRAHPEIITDLLAGDDDVSVVLEKHGDVVRFATLRTYDKESIRLLEEARAEHRLAKRQGYGREQALADLEEVLAEIEERQGD